MSGGCYPRECDHHCARVCPQYACTCDYREGYARHPDEQRICCQWELVHKPRLSRLISAMFLRNVPSLQRAAAIKTVLALCNQEVDALQEVCSGHDMLLEDENLLKIEDRIVAKAINLQISHKSPLTNIPIKLLLPKMIQESILSLIKPILMEIVKFLANNKDLYYHSNVNRKLCWTAHGTVDESRTAKLIIKDNVIDPTCRFEIACLNCLEQDIQKLWTALPENYKQKFYRRDDGTDIRQNNLVVFWADVVRGEVAELKENRVVEFSYKSAFMYASNLGHKEATKYFFQKLTPAEREECLVNTTQFALFQYNTYYISQRKFSNIICFLLSQMNEEKQIELLKENACKVLCCFLEWPRQEFFMEMANRFRGFLTAPDFNRLSWKIMSKIKCGYKDFNYRKLVGDFRDISLATVEDEKEKPVRKSYEKEEKILKDKDIPTKISKERKSLETVEDEKGKSVTKSYEKVIASEEKIGKDVAEATKTDEEDLQVSEDKTGPLTLDAGKDAGASPSLDFLKMISSEDYKQSLEETPEVKPRETVGEEFKVREEKGKVEEPRDKLFFADTVSSIGYSSVAGEADKPSLLEQVPSKEAPKVSKTGMRHDVSKLSEGKKSHAWDRTENGTPHRTGVIDRKRLEELLAGHTTLDDQAQMEDFEKTTSVGEVDSKEESLPSTSQFHQYIEETLHRARRRFSSQLNAEDLEAIQQPSMSKTSYRDMLGESSTFKQRRESPRIKALMGRKFQAERAAASGGVDLQEQKDKEVEDEGRKKAPRWPELFGGPPRQHISDVTGAIMLKRPRKGNKRLLKESLYQNLGRGRGQKAKRGKKL